MRQHRDHREQFLSYAEAERLLDAAFGCDSQVTDNKRVRGLGQSLAARFPSTMQSAKFMRVQNQ